MNPGPRTTCAFGRFPSEKFRTPCDCGLGLTREALRSGLRHLCCGHNSEPLLPIESRTLLGLITILLTPAQSTISLYLFDTLGLEKLSRFFDKVSFSASL